MTYTNDTGKPIYADKDGNIVPEGHEAAAIQVVGVNGTLSAKEAKRYKLGDYAQEQAAEAQGEPKTKAVKAAPADKAVKAKEDK